MRPEEVREIVAECMSQAPIMPPDQVQRLVRDAVREAVAEAFTAVGLDRSEPFAVQQDMAWVRQTRLASAAVRAKAGAVLLGLLVTAAATAAWLGARALVRGDAP